MDLTIKRIINFINIYYYIVINTNIIMAILIHLLKIFFYQFISFLNYIFFYYFLLKNKYKNR